jgi:uncharacterized membrane protein
MLRVILIDAFPRVLSLSLAPLSLYLLVSSFRRSKSDRKAIVPYFVSRPILSLGVIMSCGSVSALVALVSEPHFANQLLLVESLILSFVPQMRECCLRAEFMTLNFFQSHLASRSSYHP